MAACRRCTKIPANASKHGAVSYGHAVEQMQLAMDQISELPAKRRGLGVVVHSWETWMEGH